MTSYIGGGGATSDVRYLALDSGNAIASGRRVRDVSNKIWQLDPNNAALTTLLRNLRKQKVKDVKFEWLEDVFPQQYTTTTGGESTVADTTIPVASGTGIYGRIHDVWMVSDTGEVMLIESVSSNTWTVVRGIGGTTAANIPTGATLFYIGNAQETGSSARAKLTTVVDNPYNYCQIFKEGWEITLTADATSLYGGKDRTYLRQKHGDLHNRDVERAFWFGVRDDIGNGETSITSMVYTTKGVFNFLSTNEETNSTAFTEEEFEIILEGAFRYGNKTKFMFCSPRACTIIDGWARDKLDMVPADTTYGIAISRYKSSHGVLNIIKNDLFYDFADTGGSPDYGKCSVILDLADLGYRYLIDTQLRMGIQENDKDTYEDEYRTQCGLFLKNEQHHTEIHNWSST